MKAATLAIGIGLAGLAGGCAPSVESHGFMPPPEVIERIQVGVDTRTTVQRTIGRPSTSGVFDQRGWYYVTTQIEHFAFYEPEVIDRRVLAIEFDQADRVAAVRQFGLEDGRVVDLETRTTPTHGRQLTILQQLLGNLGSLSGEDFFSDE